MSNIVAETAAAPVAAAKKIGGWAKAAPLVFTVLLLLVLIAAIRFREKLVAFLGRIPIVRSLAGLTSAKAAEAPSAPTGG